MVRKPIISRFLITSLSLALMAGCLNTDNKDNGGGGAKTVNAAEAKPDADPNPGLASNQVDMMGAEAGGAKGDAAVEDMVDAAVPDMTPPDMAVMPDAMPEPEPACTRDFECNDSNPCTDDLCDNGSCTNTNNEAPCDDELFCNGVAQCTDGMCRLGASPCPSPDECDEEADICLACDVDARAGVTGF